MLINGTLFRGVMKRKIVFLVWFFVCFLSTAVFASEEKQLFEQGIQYLKQDQHEKAVDTFTALIAIDPRNPDAYKNRGVAYMKLDQYDLAIMDFEKTREIIPDLKGLYSNLGVAWYYKADYQKAIENYDKEISLSPDSHYAYFNRAICWAELKEYGKSLKDISHTLALAPDFYLAHCLKGDILLEIKDMEAARSAYEKALEVDPEQAYARDQLEKIGPAPVRETQPEPDEMADSAQTVAQPAASPKVTPSEGETKTEAKPETQSKEKRSGYEIQAGAYQEKGNAQKKMSQLVQKGYNARILVLTRPNKITWYLVRTGTYPDRKQAEQAKSLFIKDTGMDAFVRPRDRF
jgi:tetratricopeptide (TPR) repeat protein